MNDPAPEGWRMSPDDVVKAATSFCEARSMEEHILWGPPTIVVDSNGGTRCWLLLYDQNGVYDGDHFLLTVFDSTGEIELLGGE